MNLGFDVGQNQLFNFSNYIIWYFYVIFIILGLGYIFPCFFCSFNVVQSNQGSKKKKKIFSSPSQVFFVQFKCIGASKDSLVLKLIKIQNLSIVFFGGFQNPITVQIEGISCEFEVYYQKLAFLFLFHQRERHIFFLQSFVT